MSKGSSNITMKLKYINIIPIYSFTDKLHCLINTATALLELLTDCPDIPFTSIFLILYVKVSIQIYGSWICKRGQLLYCFSN